MFQNPMIFALIQPVPIKSTSQQVNENKTNIRISISTSNNISWLGYYNLLSYSKVCKQFQFVTVKRRKWNIVLDQI